MFSNLRANQQIFILHKEATPYLEKGIIATVSAPVPNFNTYGQPTAYTVDVSARVGEQLQTFQKLPANADIADWGGNGNMVVATTRDAMSQELSALKQRSADVIKSVDYHRNIIDVCDKILQDLNPEAAEKAAQAMEIDNLKLQISGMQTSVAELMKMNQQLLAQLQGGSKADKADNKK